VEFHQNNPQWNGVTGITDEIFDNFVQFTKTQNFEYQIEGENELTAFMNFAKESELPEDIITSSKDLLARLDALKETDILKHKNRISKILLTEFAEKYYGSKDKISYSLKSDIQLHEAVDVILNQGEYKKILAIK
jgi:carboxyl-terminal processing protease